MDKIEKAYTPGQWYTYFYETQNKEQSVYFNNLKRKYESWYSFLQKDQISGKIYDFLGVPNEFGKIKKKQLCKIYKNEISGRSYDKLKVQIKKTVHNNSNEKLTLTKNDHRDSSRKQIQMKSKSKLPESQNTARSEKQLDSTQKVKTTMKTKTTNFKFFVSKNNGKVDQNENRIETEEKPRRDNEKNAVEWNQRQGDSNTRNYNPNIKDLTLQSDEDLFEDNGTMLSQCTNLIESSFDKNNSKLPVDMSNGTNINKQLSPKAKANKKSVGFTDENEYYSVSSHSWDRGSDNSLFDDGDNAFDTGFMSPEVGSGSFVDDDCENVLNTGFISVEQESDSSLREDGDNDFDTGFISPEQGQESTLDPPIQESRIIQNYEQMSGSRSDMEASMNKVGKAFDRISLVSDRHLTSPSLGASMSQQGLTMSRLYSVGASSADESSQVTASTEMFTTTFAVDLRAPGALQSINDEYVRLLKSLQLHNPFSGMGDLRTQSNTFGGYRQTELQQENFPNSDSMVENPKCSQPTSSITTDQIHNETMVDSQEEILRISEMHVNSAELPSLQRYQAQENWKSETKRVPLSEFQNVVKNTVSLETSSHCETLAMQGKAGEPDFYPTVALSSREKPDNHPTYAISSRNEHDLNPHFAIDSQSNPDFHPHFATGSQNNPDFNPNFAIGLQRNPDFNPNFATGSQINPDFNPNFATGLQSNPDFNPNFAAGSESNPDFNPMLSKPTRIGDKTFESFDSTYERVQNDIKKVVDENAREMEKQPKKLSLKKQSTSGILTLTACKEPEKLLYIQDVAERNRSAVVEPKPLSLEVDKPCFDLDLEMIMSQRQHEDTAWKLSLPHISESFFNDPDISKKFREGSISVSTSRCTSSNLMVHHKNFTNSAAQPNQDSSERYKFEGTHQKLDDAIQHKREHTAAINISEMVESGGSSSKSSSKEDLAPSDGSPEPANRLASSFPRLDNLVREFSLWNVDYKTPTRDESLGSEDSLRVLPATSQRHGRTRQISDTTAELRQHPAPVDLHMTIQRNVTEGDGYTNNNSQGNAIRERRMSSVVSNIILKPVRAERQIADIDSFISKFDLNLNT